MFLHVVSKASNVLKKIVRLQVTKNLPNSKVSACALEKRFDTRLELFSVMEESNPKILSTVTVKWKHWAKAKNTQHKNNKYMSIMR